MIKHLDVGGWRFFLHFFLRFLHQFRPPQVSGGLGAVNKHKNTVGNYSPSTPVGLTLINVLLLLRYTSSTRAQNADYTPAPRDYEGVRDSRKLKFCKSILYIDGFFYFFFFILFVYAQWEHNPTNIQHFYPDSTNLRHRPRTEVTVHTGARRSSACNRLNF